MTPRNTKAIFRAFLLGIVFSVLLAQAGYAAAEVWVFFRSDIPLYSATIQELSSQAKWSQVLCPVGKTSFSFLESHPPDMAIAIGEAGLQLALSMKWDVPILAALIDDPPTDPRVKFLDTRPPYAMQLRILKQLAPDIDTGWYPYVSEKFAPCNDLKQAADSARTKIITNRLDDPRSLPETLHILTRQQCAVLLPPDPRIMNDAIIGSIFLAAFKSRSLVVGFSEALVKRGAAFAYVLSPETLALALAEMIKETSDKGRSNSPIRRFNKWSLILNSTILEKLKFQIPDKVKNSAEKIF